MTPEPHPMRQVTLQEKATSPAAGMTTESSRQDIQEVDRRKDRKGKRKKGGKG